MKKGDFKLFAGSFLITLMALGGPILASQTVLAETQNTVHVDQLVLSRCGTQYVYASGSATYGPKAHYLLIDINGAHAFNVAKQTFWTTGLVKLDPGQHIVTARIHNTDGTHTDTTRQFTVPDCPQADPGDEQDCCPGPDPVVSEPKPKPPRVKAISAVRSTAMQGLSPLNSLFRLVFGRGPAYEEWKYWADRYLTDKPTWEAILGAMQWHKLHRQTTGI